jgi:hypothetical protein
MRTILPRTSHPTQPHDETLISAVSARSRQDPQAAWIKFQSLSPSNRHCAKFLLSGAKATHRQRYRLYATAVLELEKKDVSRRVDAAEAAIQGRLRDLQHDSDHHEERQLMEDAQRRSA